jgi:hypothetical protein
MADDALALHLVGAYWQALTPGPTEPGTFFTRFMHPITRPSFSGLGDFLGWQAFGGQNCAGNGEVTMNLEGEYNGTNEGPRPD